MAHFFDRYIKHITQPLEEAFELYAPTALFSSEKINALGDRIYAPNKWTIKQIIQHCIDTERIMSYRALCFARGEKNMLPPFNEDDYAAAAGPIERSLENLLAEFEVVRKSTILLYLSLNDQQLQQFGTANHISLSTYEVFQIILGHPIHHLQVIEERYYPLLEA